MDDDTATMLLLLTFVIALMAWIALRRTKALARDLLATRARLTTLETAFDRMRRALPAHETPLEPVPLGPVPLEAPPLEAPGETAPPLASPPPAPPPTQTRPRPATAPERTSAPRLTSAPQLTSEWLAGRGLVWIGALALGFSGLFLIRYSMENGLLGPWARVIAGLALGTGLITIGTWLSRRSAPEPNADGSPTSTTIPPVSSQTALIGSGISTLFCACYGAYGLYGLIGALPAFVLLAAIAIAALVMALRHGPVIALIGLIGALMVPALVSGADPAPLNLFLYLAGVAATGLVVVRMRGWWWLDWIVVGGAVGWALLWLAFHASATDTLVTAVFANAVLLVLPVALHGFAASRADDAGPQPRAWTRRAPPPLKLMMGATTGAMLILVFGLRLENYGAVTLTGMACACGFTLWAALRQPRLLALPWLAATGTVLAYWAWHLPLPIDRGWVGIVDGHPIGHMPHALFEPAFLSYSLTGLAVAALFGVGGWVGVTAPPLVEPDVPERDRTKMRLMDAYRTGCWALLSVLAPLLVLIIAYSRTHASAISPPWAAAALALGALLLAATATLQRRLNEAPAPGLALAVAVYAAGVCAAITLAMVMVLHDFWLTVAMSLQLPALAWIERRTHVPEMRRLALALAAVVLVRLMLNPGIAGYAIATTPILNGLLYGYGLPLAAFVLAQRLFRANRHRNGESEPPDNLLDSVLQVGWIACLVLLVSLQIRHLIGHGTITHGGYHALEQGLQVTWWGALAVALMHANRKGVSRVLACAWRVLGVVALFHVLLFALIDENPLWRTLTVGPWPVFNLVTLNYGVPAALSALAAFEARRQGLAFTQRACGLSALILTWLFVTLTVRQAFQGATLGATPPSDGEWYAYSAAWLIYGGTLLGLGLRLDNATLRSAAMVVVVATVLKVFLFDMSALAGLLRVASFLGLGLALVLIGWLHQTALKTRQPSPSPPF